MGKRYTVCTVQTRKMPVPERYMHVYWVVSSHLCKYFCSRTPSYPARESTRIMGQSSVVSIYLMLVFVVPEHPLIPPETQPQYRTKVLHCNDQLLSLNIFLLTFGSFNNRHLTKNATVPDFVAQKLAGKQAKIIFRLCFCIVAQIIQVAQPMIFEWFKEL